MKASRKKKKTLHAPKEKRLFPSFADPSHWRMGDFHIVSEGKGKLRVVYHKENRTAWRHLRQRILERDNFTCRYCGFRAHKWQFVHHIDGDPKNNDPSNLETICPMCNLILHAGYGCTVLAIVDLYKQCKYSQAEVVRRTRSLRGAGYTDEQIVKKLGLREKVPFKMERKYLRRLMAFVTYRESSKKDPTLPALEYGYQEASAQLSAQRRG